MKAIELKDVTFSYEGYEKKVLKNASFSVEYGELALLSGYSGEGKSTVLSLIAGIIPNITSGELTGEVLIAGESIYDKKMSEVCRKVGVVLQNADAQIIQQLVEDEIAFGCENFAFSKEKIRACIVNASSRMKLQPQWKTRTLSGGQKQRLITACTLATEQKIIVLDEPLANLDKAGAKLLMEALRSLTQEGYAVLIIEHRLDMVLPYVDTVWSIFGGVISKVLNKQEYLSAQGLYIQSECQPVSTQKTAFSLKSVGFSVKGREILKDITFDVNKGERILLLGENGCGKTTLLRLIAGLSFPTKGKITHSFAPELTPKQKGSRNWFRKVGVVYQNPNYQLFMPTVRQEIAYGAESEDSANEITEMFGLTALADRHPQSLSEGQKRRVSIAAVAAAKPDLLLLDEPTVGQDYRGLKELVRVLNTLHEKSGNTMVTVTHDMRCAEALCDRAVLIEGGCAAAKGSKELVREYFAMVP